MNKEETKKDKTDGSCCGSDNVPLRPAPAIAGVLRMSFSASPNIHRPTWHMYSNIDKLHGTILASLYMKYMYSRTHMYTASTCYISPVWSHCSPIAVGGAIRNGLVSRKTASTRTCAEKVRRRSKWLDSLTSETKQMLLHAHGDLHIIVDVQKRRAPKCWGVVKRLIMACRVVSYVLRPFRQSNRSRLLRIYFGQVRIEICFVVSKRWLDFVLESRVRPRPDVIYMYLNEH